MQNKKKSGRINSNSWLMWWAN